MVTKFAHDPEAHRYKMTVDGRLVSTLEYFDHGSSLVFNHTVTVPSERGHGYAAELVRYAVDDVEANGRGPITPSCWYVAEWFDRHPGRSGLLAAR